MSKSFDDRHLDELKQRADLVQYIQRTLPLKKRGARWVGLCPFHGDQSPSFQVTPQMGIYKCFACGAGGDIFKYAMEREKLSFPEAVEQIAEWCGYVLPERKPEPVDPKRKGALDLLEFSARHFHQRLGTELEVQSYLTQRGFQPKLIEEFSLGWARNSWDDLCQAALQAGFSQEMLVSTGMAAQKEQRVYDRFRGRVIIPIRNATGQIVAFGGRTLDPNEPAKYLNSPETDYYHKSDLLFGLSHAKKEIASKNAFLVVEGYMDFLQLWNHGFQNVVAVSGTALTQQHVKRLVRLARKSFLMFDADKAGQNAIRRSLPLLLQENIEIRIPVLPNGEDPDSLLLSLGATALQKCLDEAPLWIHWLCDQFKNHQTPEEHAQNIQSLRSLIDQIPDPLIAEEYRNLAANHLGISVEHLGGQAKSETQPPPRPKAQPTPINVRPAPAAPPVNNGPVQSLVEIAFWSNELRSKMAKELNPRWLPPGGLSNFLDTICAWELHGLFEIGRFLQSLNPKQRDWVERLLSRDRCEDLELLSKDYIQTLTFIQVQHLEGRWKGLKLGGHKEKALWAQVQSPMTTLIQLRKIIANTNTPDPIQMQKFQELLNHLDQSLPHN